MEGKRTNPRELEPTGQHIRVEWHVEKEMVSGAEDRELGIKRIGKHAMADEVDRRTDEVDVVEEGWRIISEPDEKPEAQYDQDADPAGRRKDGHAAHHPWPRTAPVVTMANSSPDATSAQIKNQNSPDSSTHPTLPGKHPV